MWITVFKIFNKQGKKFVKRNKFVNKKNITGNVLSSLQRIFTALNLPRFPGNNSYHEIL